MNEDFDVLPKMAGWHGSKLTIPEGATVTMAAPKPNHNFIFHQADASGWANGPPKIWREVEAALWRLTGLDQFVGHCWPKAIFVYR